MSLPGEMGEILSPVLCEETGHPDVKVPGQMLPSASTQRVNGENIANAASMFASFGESETFGETNHPIPCNSIPIEEKVPSPIIKFPAQSMTASHPIGVDEYFEDCVCRAPTHVQSILTHDPAITSPNEPLNWPRLVCVAKSQPQ